MDEGRNLVPNGDFQRGAAGQLPHGWELCTARDLDYLRPTFRLAHLDGRQMLLAEGAGKPDCTGWLLTRFPIRLGRTYRLRVRFRPSPEVDPNMHLLFALYADNHQHNNHGIFRFRRLPDGWAEGENRFLVFGEGMAMADVRIYYRYCAHGHVWIRDVHLEECEPIPPQPVRLTCTFGRTDMDAWARVVQTAAEGGADLVLIPEAFSGSDQPEPMDGPSATLLSTSAAANRCYVAGTFYYHDAKVDRLYNAAMLFDRQGQLVGRYYKNHPFSPEVFFTGITPGTEVPVFETDFGKVGMIICYDGWFSDVVELLALKGARIVLWPAAGFFHGVMAARACDHGVVMVASSLNSGLAIYDTTGADVTNPNRFDRFFTGKESFSDVVETRVGDVRLLSATIDLSLLQPPANYGAMWSAPGGYRNRREQKRLLYADIQREVERWWEE